MSKKKRILFDCQAFFNPFSTPKSFFFSELYSQQKKKEDIKIISGYVCGSNLDARYSKMTKKNCKQQSNVEFCEDVLKNKKADILYVNGFDDYFLDYVKCPFILSIDDMIIDRNPSIPHIWNQGTRSILLILLPL